MVIKDEESNKDYVKIEDEELSILTVDSNNENKIEDELKEQVEENVEEVIKKKKRSYKPRNKK